MIVKVPSSSSLRPPCPVEFCICLLTRSANKLSEGDDVGDGGKSQQNDQVTLDGQVPETTQLLLGSTVGTVIPPIIFINISFYKNPTRILSNFYYFTKFYLLSRWSRQSHTNTAHTCNLIKYIQKEENTKWTLNLEK